MAKLSLEDLRRLRESKRKEMRKRDAEGKDIQIIVGMGTCGIAAGAKNTLDSFIDALDGDELADTVMIRQSGCMGYCNSEPTVKVIVPGMPGVLYGKVDNAAARDIIKTHIKGRELVKDHVLDGAVAD
ncbi:MAG: (2Fe-2S) ferredoxin domain-containing protein [Treponema sp.]|jgi:NADP-reducing hydrogenase subunit HndB|nr:(2Fe-2S) ferredoxin domain-containing protein [Treponema sp.]